MSCARACIYIEFPGGGIKVLDWMFTVIWSILDRSGNWAASAFKSTGWSACMVGGRSWPSINF